LAATPKTENNDPDWTCGTLIGKTPDKQFYVLDHTWLQGTPSQVETLIRNTASQDGRHVAISLPQDPAQSGKAQALAFIRMLAGYNVSATTEARNPGGMGAVSESRLSAKVTRFAPFSAQAEAGNVRFLRGPWNTRLFDELEAFPEVAHDDAADSISRSFAALIAPPAPARVQQLRL
jgi:predicted phage terminase large subunit-like protein